MKNSEYLSEDILDANFVKCFAPIHILQLMLGSNRTDIRDGFITTITCCQKLYSILWIALTSFSFCYFEVFYYNTYYNKNTTLLIACEVGAFLQYMVYLVNMINSRFICGQKSVDVYLLLQKIDRILKLNHFETLNNAQFYINLISVLFMTTAYGIGYTVHVIYCTDRPSLTIFLGLSLTTIYLEILLTASLVYYVGVRLRFLHNLMLYNIITQKNNNIPGVDHSWTLRDNYRMVPISADTRFENDPMVLKNVIKCLRTVMEAYKVIVKLCRFSVLSTACAVFLWVSFVIEAMVVGLRKNLYPVIGAVTISLWICFYFLQLVVLAMACDWFVKQINSIKSLAIYALSVYTGGPVYNIAKDLIRLMECEKTVFSVYGIFVMDKNLPLKLIRVITSNVLMMLQFTLE